MYAKESHGYASAPTTVGPDAPVQQQIRLLTNAVDDLRGTVDEVVRRLYPVLRNQDAEPCPPEVRASYGESEVEQGIGLERGRVEDAIFQLRKALGLLRV